MNQRPGVGCSWCLRAVLIVIVGLIGYSAWAQGAKVHRIVFEVSGDGTQAWEMVLNNVENVQTALGAENTEIRIVAHGKGLGLLRQTNTALEKRITALAGPRVTFVACQNTMQRLQITKADLLPVAGTVDSGVAEAVRLQEAGWSYIKSGS